MTAPTIHVDHPRLLGESIYLMPDEIPAVVAALLVEADRLEDAL